MASKPTSTREASAIAKKQLAIRELHWPTADAYLWDRKAHKGFTTIPKTMPMILKIMDEMTKGAPVSSTYLTLWCNTWDNSFVVLNKNGEMGQCLRLWRAERGAHLAHSCKEASGVAFHRCKAGAVWTNGECDYLESPPRDPLASSAGNSWPDSS